MTVHQHVTIAPGGGRDPLVADGAHHVVGGEGGGGGRGRIVVTVFNTLINANLAWFTIRLDLFTVLNVVFALFTRLYSMFLEPNSIEKFWPEFRLQKPLEFWF